METPKKSPRTLRREARMEEINERLDYLIEYEKKPTKNFPKDFPVQAITFKGRFKGRINSLDMVAVMPEPNDDYIVLFHTVKWYLEENIRQLRNSDVDRERLIVNTMIDIVKSKHTDWLITNMKMATRTYTQNSNTQVFYKLLYPMKIRQKAIQQMNYLRF